MYAVLFLQVIRPLGNWWQYRLGFLGKGARSHDENTDSSDDHDDAESKQYSRRFLVTRGDTEPFQ